MFQWNSSVRYKFFHLKSWVSRRTFLGERNRDSEENWTGLLKFDPARKNVNIGKEIVRFKKLILKEINNVAIDQSHNQTGKLLFRCMLQDNSSINSRFRRNLMKKFCVQSRLFLMFIRSWSRSTRSSMRLLRSQKMLQHKKRLNRRRGLVLARNFHSMAF